MRLDVTLRFRIDDVRSGVTRRFTKKTTGEYPHVPRIGEAVLIFGRDQSTNIGAAESRT